MTVCLNEEIIQAYLDRELAADAAAAVLKHLNRCMSCAAIAQDLEEAAALINRAFDEELSGIGPNVNLRARLEDALAQTKTPAVAGHSFMRELLNLVPVRLKAGELSPFRLGLAVAVLIFTAILAGGLASNFWRSTTTEQNREMVQQDDPPVPVPTSPVQHQVKEQRPELADSGRYNQHRTGQIAHRIKPEPARPKFLETAISTMRHTKPLRKTTLQILETSEHLRQTQLLLRSFRNTSIDESDDAFDLAYEKQLSRELLSKNRLFRRRAENKEDSQATELLTQIEPLLLDIANLPEKASQDDVHLIKELMREQKIIATLQIYTARAGY
jgi:hypothetical protein